MDAEAFHWENLRGEVPTATVTRIKITPEIASRTYELQQKTSATEALTDLVAESKASSSYLIGVGDVLSIIVWDHPELTAPFGSFNSVEEQGSVVREDGNFYYPFIGTVQADGRTVGEVRDELATRLSSFIERPQVDVRVAAYRSQRFFMTGAVKEPGSFPITDVPISLVEAISLAGGLTRDADIFDVRVTRKETSVVIPLYAILYEGEVSANINLQDGDVVNVAPNERRQVFVLGEVVTPQTLPMTDRPLSLTQALSAAGGIEETRADSRGVYVIRRSEFDGVIDVFQLDVSEAWAFVLGDQFLLQQRDVVYVSAAPVTRWNRWVSNVLPSVLGISNIDRNTRQ